MKFIYTWPNITRGLLIYAIGDSVAAFIEGSFSVYRLLGMMLAGATIYAFEVPNYFRFIEKKMAGPPSFLNSLKRTGMSMLYFSPLWVARHLCFIKLFSGQWHEISWKLLQVAAISFLYNIPVLITANYIIQNKLPLKWRFVGSAVFSGLMAVYYALAATWFK